MKRIGVVGLALCAGVLLGADSAEKRESVARLRQEFAKTTPWLDLRDKRSGAELLSQLDENGSFRDLAKLEADYRKNNWGDPKFDSSAIQTPVLNMLSTAFERLLRIALDLRAGKIPEAERAVAKAKLYRGVLNYCGIEFDRGDRIRSGRFHGSCFAMPKAGAWIYLAMLGDMESGSCPEVAEALKRLAFQSWSQPVRGDATDKKIVDVQRFRKHVWWVGGNATAYRPLLEAALVNDSPEMIDVLSEVVAKSISNVSQNTYDDAFWIEGFTADGAGWGHGRQCLIWGYPIHGTNGSLNIISKLKGTPWASALDDRALDAIFNFFRGSSFYFYKGTIPPVLERGNARPGYADKREIPSLSLADNLNRNFRDRLSREQLAELDRFRKEAKEKNLFMLNFPSGEYHGTRYFFNNDDLIRKNPDYYAFVNMVSNRSNGLESYYGGASGFNLFTCDGQTLFEREGGESAKALGAATLTMLPGTTERQVKMLKPVENWLGYGSKGDFAAGAVAPDQDAAAGFIFDKVNDSVIEKPSRREDNPEILKVRANKAYFFFGDLFLALGAGIENLAPEYDGNIFTTVEQTLKKDGGPAVRKHGVEWVGNNGFVYGVLPQATTGKITHRSEKRMTEWRKLSEANKNAEENEVELFSMWIDHGRKVKDGTYAYFVSCDGKVPEQLPEILSNTVKLQAARQGDTVGAVFYDSAAKLKSPFGVITVSAPCALVAKFADGRVELTVADGRMNRDLKAVTVTVRKKPYTIELPSGELLGKAATGKF
ncbi:MAG: hypothetical protein HPZ91_04990 [Lentisphaeria bacterium]|nr:hypothetical protein [Lentisphaeria bacterium]